MPYRESPREYPETQDEGRCEDCGLVFDDLTFVWYDKEEGVAECPECMHSIYKAAPEDFDRDDWNRRHRL